MSIPPVFMSVHITENGKKIIGFWLPLFLIWILLFIPFVLLLLIAVLVDGFMILGGKRLNITALLWGLVSVLSALQGLSLDIKSKRDNKTVKVYIF